MNNFGYLGDDAWQNFARLFEKTWKDFGRKNEVLNMVNGDEMLAMVVSQVSSEPEKWLSTKVPALKGKTPVWCLNNGRGNQLRAILMSMPR